MTTVNIPLYRVDDIQFPFVEGTFVCKTGKVLKGLFLVDSGSSNNVFNAEALRTLDVSWITEDTKKLTAIDNEGEVCKLVNLNINVGGCESDETFCISTNVDFATYFGKNCIIGILGARYMADHNLVLDFAEKSLHTSALEKFQYQDKSFAFPMGYGFKHYGIPVVGFEKDGQEFLCVVDSGANSSTLTQLAMENGSSDFKHNKEQTGSVEGVSGKFESTIADVSMDLISLGDKEGEIVYFKDREEFQILSGRDYLASSDNEEVSPISGLLGTPYMLKRKWVLDFKVGVVYAKAA